MIMESLNFCMRGLKNKNSVISKFNVVNYLYSNNTNSIFSIFDSEKNIQKQTSKFLIIIKIKFKILIS